MFVLKKDNKTKECFQEHKIRHAIEKAYKSLKREFDESVFEETLKVLGVDDSDTSESVISVYKIQDIIEDIIFKRGDKELYDAFHWVKKKWLEVEYEKKLMCKSIENQNANVDEYSFGGREAESASVYRKAYALDRCVSKRTKRLHENNENYIHDLDSLVSGKHNCLTEPLNKVLNEGAIVGQTNIRPAASINSAMQLTAVYFQIQSQEQFGGVSGSSYDWTMIPFVRKSFFKHYVINYIKQNEELTFDRIWKMSMDDIDDWVNKHKEEYLNAFGLKFEDFRFGNQNKLDKNLVGLALLDTKLEAMQAAEALIHNLNTLQSRPGSQLPFSSLNYGTCYIPEGQLIIECLLDASIRGTGKNHLTPIFPCGIFQLKKGINRKPGDPNYHLFRKALESTSKRIYPNYANCDWSNQKSWKKADIEVKERVIGELNEVETMMLIERLKNDKTLAEKLSILSFDNDKIVIDTEEKRRIALQTFPVADVWGIGRQAHKKLASAGVVTALDFAEQSPEFAKNLLHKPGLLTWQELNGSDCIDISDRAERQSISQSRTFLHPIVDRVTMEKVLIDFTTYCAEKLRKQKGLCQQMIVYAHTSRFAEETRVIHQVITLPFPTNITSELVSYMLAALRRKWRVCPYKKAGVVLTTIVPAGQVQQMLFDERPKERDERLQKAIDHINMQHGKQAVKTAAQLITTNTQLLTKQERLSPCYTTNIQDILVLKC